MTHDPALLDLGERLEKAGMIVVRQPEYLSVRLPYFCSVQVRLEDGRLACAPFFGVIPRTRATLIKLIGTSVVAVAALTTYGPAPLPLALGFLVAASGVYDLLRTTVTENIITRVMFIWTIGTLEDRASLGGSSSGGGLLHAPMAETSIRVSPMPGIRRDLH